jgi:hypothetical protein
MPTIKIITQIGIELNKDLLDVDILEVLTIVILVG